MELIILVYLIYNNCVRAKKKQLNVFAWGFFTILAVFLSQTIGAALVVTLFYQGKIVATNMAQARTVADSILLNPLHSLFIVFCGVGGYLFIRYRLDKKQDVITGE